jgi:exodeoxyribonuclease-3
MDGHAQGQASGRALYTFWKYVRSAFARDAGLRIDHLLVSPALTGRLQSAQVERRVRGWEKTSDHAPVSITLSDGRRGA